MPTDSLFEDVERLLAASAAAPGDRMPAPFRGAAPSGSPAGAGGTDELAVRVAELARRASAITAEDGGSGRVAARPASAALDQIGNSRQPWRSPAGIGRALSPVVSSLIGLFRRRRDEEPLAGPSLFRLPEAVSVDAGFSRREGGAIREVSRGVEPAPRLAPAPGPITINVQAIDSRSFLDHSDSIARAVREAMLNTHSINDVVNDL